MHRDLFQSIFLRCIHVGYTYSYFFSCVIFLDLNTQENSINLLIDFGVVLSFFCHYEQITVSYLIRVFFTHGGQSFSV